MATHMNTPPEIGWVDKRKAASNDPTTELPAALTDALVDHASMDASLLANGYTQVQIDSMTQNDKVYALRLVHDATGIQQKRIKQ